MITEDIVKKWKIEHYIGYLYLAVSFADSNLLKEEVEMCHMKLESFLEKYYPEMAQSPSPVIDEIIYEITNHTIDEMNTTIKSLYQRFYIDELLKNEIISDLSDIESVDDDLSIEEHKMIQNVKELFEVK